MTSNAKFCVSVHLNTAVHSVPFLHKPKYDVGLYRCVLSVTRLVILKTRPFCQDSRRCEWITISKVFLQITALLRSLAELSRE